MRRRLPAVLAIFGFVLGALLVPAGSASALTCGVGSTCLVHMTNSNVSQLNAAGIDVDVTIDNSTLGTTLLKVQWHSDGISNTPIGIDMFGYNADTLLSSVTGNTDTWTFHTPPGPTTYDGFGLFESGQNQGPSENGGIGAPLIFTMAAQETMFNLNDHGSAFVVHIRFDGNCSGFVSDGTTTSIGSNANCGGVAVPVPAGLVLMGLGLGVIGFGAVRMTGRSLQISG